MLRSVLVITLILSLFISPVVAGTPRGFESVPPLTIMVDGKPTPVCAVASIDEDRKLWLTAAHCISVVSANMLRSIKGETAKIVVIDTNDDIAILQTFIMSAPALRLATRAPRVSAEHGGDEIHIIGYPRGIPFISSGTVGNPKFDFTEYAPQPGFRMLLNVAAAVGNSGGPVLNKHGEIVSVLGLVRPPDFTPFSAGITFEALKEGYGRFFASERER